MFERLIKFRTNCLRLILICCVAFNVCWAETVNQLREQAIQLARQGKIQQSYEELVLLHGRYPNDLPILYDLVELAARAGELQQSFAYSQSIPNLLEAPTYVLQHMGKVARNIGEYALSYRYYQILYSREAKADYLLGSVLATGLSQQFKLAKRSLSVLEKNYPTSIEYFIANSFLATQKKAYSKAIYTYTKGLEKYPGHPELLRGLVTVYRQLNAASLAKKIIEENPKVFHKNSENDIVGDALANRIRFSEVTKFNIIDESNYRLKTISLLEQRVADSGGSDLRAKFDLIVAYAKFNKAAQAIELYESLLADKVSVPTYV